jgi:hypothetical protein
MCEQCGNPDAYYYSYRGTGKSVSVCIGRERQCVTCMQNSSEHMDMFRQVMGTNLENAKEQLVKNWLETHYETPQVIEFSLGHSDS